MRTARAERLAGLARGEWAAALAAIALGACFWLWRLGVIDYDDGVSNELRFARRPLAQVLFDLPWADQSPLYFVLLHVWRVFGESPFAVKSLNLLLVALTVLAATAAARAAHGRTRVASATALVVALSPLCFWMVRNGRMYVPQLLLSVLTYWLALRALERRTPRALAPLVLVSALNVYNHFFALLITGVAWGALAIEWALDPRSGRARLRALAAPAAAAALLGLLLVPQLVRLAGLAQQPPSHASWSLPPLSVPYLETVQYFWFQSASWGALRDAFPPVDELFYVCVYTLAVLGTLASTRRVAVITLLWFAVPVVGLGLLAGHVDLRPRYFTFVAPALWVAIANGAVGPLPDGGLWQRARRVLGPLRVALFACFLTGSGWLLVQKLPQRYAEWTKVMEGLDRLYRPDMLLYMPPGTPRAVPHAVASHRGLHPGLRNNRRLDEETRAQFLAEVAARRSFVLLIHHQRETDEYRWRRRLLLESGYRSAVLPGYAARAEIYTTEPLDGFVLRYALEPDPPERQILDWAERRLADPQRVDPGGSRLSRALVARVRDDGRVGESILFTSQRGEAGSWRLSGEPDDAVSETRAWARGEGRDVYGAKLEPGGTLLVAFPRLRACGGLELTTGRSSAPPPGGGAPVQVTLLAGGARAVVVAPPDEGWHEQHVALDCARTTAGAVLLLRAGGDDARRFYFGVD